MDRLTQLRGEAGGSGDSTLDTTSPPSETFMSANENSSKYFSINDSTFDITSIKDESLASTSADAAASISDGDELISNLSPIGKKELDSYKIGKQIEAAKILSGGVDIFDGDDNSFDGDELVIDEAEDKANKQVERVQDDSLTELETGLVEPDANTASREMEVVLQIDGNNVNAIDIGNGLYLYRKDGQDELAAIQIIDDDPQHSFKFLKVRDNAEGNLEVYEEIEIEVPKEVPTKEGKPLDKNKSHVPNVPDTNKSKSDTSSTFSKVEGKNKSPQKEPTASTSTSGTNTEVKETGSESKSEVNLNGKMMKFSESRKSPVVGSYTPMTFHSTPNKGKPLTKTMVDLQLDPNRHSENVKKTIEVHTDHIKQKSNQTDIPPKEKDIPENVKPGDTPFAQTNISSEKNTKVSDKQEVEINVPKEENEQNKTEVSKYPENIEKTHVYEKNVEKGENTNAKQLLIEEKYEDSKTSNSSKEINEGDIDLVKTDDVLENEVALIEDKNTVILKPDKSVVPLLSISSKEDKASISSTSMNQKPATVVPTNVEQPVDRNNTIQNIKKTVEQSSNNKNVLAGSMAKASTPLIIDNVKNLVFETNKMEKDKPSKIKILENITLNFPTSGLTKKESKVDRVDISMNPDNDNIPLESFAEVSSTCANLGSEESKEESITLYSIDTDESVSLKPSSTSKIRDDKVDISDKISEVLTTVSNLNDIEIENTSSKDEKPVVSFPSVKESAVLIQAKNEADSTCKILEQISRPNLEVNTTDTSNIQENIKKHNLSVLKPTLPEKTTSSIISPKAKVSEQSQPCTVVSKEKPMIVHSAKIELKPRISESQPSPLSEIKPTEKLALPLKNPVSKATQLVPATYTNLIGKAAKSTVLQNVKIVQAPSKPESKPQEKKPISASVSSHSVLAENKYSVSLIKSSAKVTNTSSISGDVKEISSSTSNKNIKPDSHIPVVSVANKPSLKHNISAISPNIEPIPVKPITSAASQKEIAKNNLDKKSTASKSETRDVKEPIKKPNVELKPVNNNHTAAVPFGKWTDAHRQEFVNKFKEVKAPLNTNSKQIKNSNDLNRRDVLQKIDSQRAQTISNATAKSQDKLIVKPETVFTSKVVSPTVETKTLPSSELLDAELKQAPNEVATKPENSVKTTLSSALSKSYATDVNTITVAKRQFAPTSQNIVRKIETPSKEEHDAMGKTKYSTQDQDIIGKTEPITRNQSEADKTKPNPKEIVVSKTESIPGNEIVVGKKEAIFKDENTIGKNKIISRDQNITDKTEPAPRDQNTASCYMASLIDKTIEDMIHRAAPGKTTDESKQAILINSCETNSDSQKLISTQEVSKPPVSDSVSLDDIEMKMNELHGIPFVERPPHELPKIPKPEIKTYSKIDKKKPLSLHTKKMNTDTPTQPKPVKNLDSDEEIIEHEPVTGDLDFKMKNVPLKVTLEEKNNLCDKNNSSVLDKHSIDKDAEIITETEFDKFARRNSITYENCLTVNFDHKEHQNVVQTSKEKKSDSKVDTKVQSTNNEVKSKLPVPTKHHIQLDEYQNVVNVACDTGNKKYQSKIHSAYQSALTAKHQVPHPISIIEDKPVKVVFLESNLGFVPSQLNVQGKELSPAKKIETDLSPAKNDSIESNLAEVIDENKQQDKFKTKHQRKQVLTPVEEPDLELIQPSDIGIETTTKKKRKVEDIKPKSLVPKKSYLLGRNSTTEDKTTSNQVVKNCTRDISKQIEDVPEHRNTVSAIDNLVKAAELLDNQAVTDNKSITPNILTQTNTPVKRGRGRPRKYPLPVGVVDEKSPSPQKKPRLIDAKPIKQDYISDEQDDDSSEEGIIRENWTMGKINENIVCPICNKLFRSENVVFKHVKHCTGVSPNRSESDKKSPHRSRLSQDSEDINIDYDMSSSENKKETPKKRRSKEPPKSAETLETKFEADKEEVIVIEDTPIKEKSEKIAKDKIESKKEPKSHIFHQNKNLVCEFCGKTFRQQSYLTSHKLQHKKDSAKKKDKEAQDSCKLQVFSCEVCKKEFRKLHHLVQHRINHNTDSVPKRTLRKSLSEQNDTKNLKDIAVKQAEDTSAGFRCEPCDKSFRKLHHLVEHRGTHDGINRQKSSAPVLSTVEKLQQPPQCEICMKTFRKLHHLIEHRETHTDSNSEKSDEKSNKSGLSTKDIIHECSLCYMVFPNEHSLNKHSAVCSKKKRQSKQLKDTSENDSIKNDENSEKKNDVTEDASEPIAVATEIIDDFNKKQVIEEIEKLSEGKIIDVKHPDVIELKQIEDEKATFNEVTDKPLLKEEAKAIELPSAPTKRDMPKSDLNIEIENSVIPEKINKTDLKEIKAQDMPKKKIVQKNKDALQVPKRQKSLDIPLPDVESIKHTVECSDDDEVRYMINPNFKFGVLTEGKSFMKVRATKRNSLQIERPNSNNHAKRRTSLQLPAKTSRLKQKVTEPKTKTSEPKQLNLSDKTGELKQKIYENKNSSKSKHAPKLSEAETLLSTDSDDSEVKYSFPKTAPETSNLTGLQTTKAPEGNTKDMKKKVLRKSVAGKQKPLSGIAKRKSLGKIITAKHKDATVTLKQIKRRSLGVEHRCDCGELFSSAALLARHTSLAHTPPRIRRRRDPPASPAPDKPKPIRKSSARSVPTPPATKPNPRKSSAKKADPTTLAPLADSRKSLKSLTQPEAKIAPKTRRSAAHSGVPVPEKMRKMMEKNKK